MRNNELHKKLDENSQYIGDIDNYYGGLSISREGGRYYWSIENWDGQYWKEIPEYLYVALSKYQEEYKHTFE